jgi:Fe2+ or Zn2+ uptake regulation protein
MTNTQKFDQIKNIFLKKSIRMTPARKEIVNVFLDNDGHMNAEDVYNKADRKKIGLATVYRTLEILKTNNIIKDIFINGEHLYELAMDDDKKFHFHFSCSSCGKLQEYNNVMLSNHIIAIKNHLEQNMDNDVLDMCIVMKGICKSCKKQK